MYKNILVPVDVFEIGLADKALSHAQFLAQSSSGQIHLVHIIPSFSPVLTRGFISDARKMEDYLINTAKEGANKQVISSQADSLIKISRIWADFFPANTSNQPI